MTQPAHISGHAINGVFPLNDASEARALLGKNTRISFEIFPAATPAGQRRLIDEIKSLSAARPDYISVTYGAGGKNRAGSLDTVTQLLAQTGLEVMAHLTHGGQSRSEILEMAETLRQAGVRDILALRGDSQRADAGLPDAPFASTLEFITALRAQGWTSIRTAAYPDIHKDAESAKQDFDWLLRKFDAGATEAITQFFFDADSFFRLRDRLDRYGLASRLVPGILAFRDIPRLFEFAQNCGVRIPDPLRAELSGNTDESLYEAHSLSVLLDLCMKLSSGGVQHFHIYTLNRAGLTLNLLKLLGLPALADRQPGSDSVKSAQRHLRREAVPA